MAVIFADPGGEYYFGLGSTVPVNVGIWNNEVSATLVTSTPAGRSVASDGKSYSIAFGNSGDLTKIFPTNYSHLIIGYAIYLVGTGFVNNTTIILFQDNTTEQCSLRTNGSGDLFVSRAGTTISGPSSVALNGGWNYVEIEVTFTTGATGAVQCWLNGTSILNTSSVQTTTSGNAYANRVSFEATGTQGATQNYLKDIYMLDATTGSNTSHLGDITVNVEYPNAAGTHSQWTEQVGGKSGTGGTLTITQVSGTGVYTFSDTGVANSQLVGYNISVTGFTNGANNITNLAITGNTTTTFTVSATTTIETHAATGTFQCLVQDGINHLGTWPDGDSGYIVDGTASDISDFGHTALSLTGTLYSVVHASYVRKDDASSKTFRQVCISGGTTETNGSDIPATNSYVYYFDYLDVDPNTSAQWSVSNYNSSTWGAKVIS